MSAVSALSPDDRFTRPIAAILFFSIAIMVVGQSCLFTILPPIGRQIGLSDTQIGVVMSIHGLFMLFAGPWWGALSETVGRRRVILIGAALYVISTLFFVLNKTSPLFNVRLMVTSSLLSNCLRKIFLDDPD